MSGPVMVVALWAAAIYRVVLSVRSETTVWRTAFTTCVLAVAIGATSSVYGDQSIDVWSGVWNLSLLLTRLALTGAAVAASIYLVTLRREVVPMSSVRLRLAAGAVLAALQVGAWLAAPVHDREFATTSEVTESSTSGALFAVAFSLAIVLATVEVAHFCFSRAASRVDVTRTISLLLTGTACVAGAALFALGTISALVHELTGVGTAPMSDVINGLLPSVAVILALGTLSLLVAPPLVDLVRSYLRWRAVRPLWVHLVRLQPEVHLDVAATGGPLVRLHFRLQRAIVEIHDALRNTAVSVPPTADVDDLADALHTVGGSRMAAEVLAQARTPDADDSQQLLALARSYSRKRSCSR